MGPWNLGPGSYGALWPFQILDANWKHGLMSKLARLTSEPSLARDGGSSRCLPQASIPILSQMPNVRAHKATLDT